MKTALYVLGGTTTHH